MAMAVPVGPGDRMTVRMPSRTERQDYQIAEGRPALEIRRENGTIELVDAGLAEIIFVADDHVASEPVEEDAQRG